MPVSRGPRCPWAQLAALALAGALWGGTVAADVPLVLAAPGDDPARNAWLAQALPAGARLVADSDAGASAGASADADAAAFSGAEETLSRAAAQGWDMIALDEAAAIAACRGGQLRPAPHGLRAAGALPTTLAWRRVDGRGDRACALGHEARLEALAYRVDAFALAAPETALAVFDTVSFPGPRAVAWPPRALLEWAIMAEGVPGAQVYDILSTERGMRLARAAIASIGSSLVWVDSDAEAARLLATGEVSMAVGAASVLTAAAGAAAVVVPDGKIGVRRAWVAVPGGAVSSGAEAEAAGPARAVAVALAEGGALPRPALWRDAAWYARAQAHIAAGVAGLQRAR